MTDVNIEEMDFETFLKNNVELESFDAKAVLLEDRKQMLQEMQRQAEQEAVIQELSTILKKRALLTIRF